MLAGFATGIAWALPAAALLTILLFPWLWIFAILPGPALGLLIGLWRAYRAAAQAGGTRIQHLRAVLAVLAGVTAVVVPIVSWRIVVS